MSEMTRVVRALVVLASSVLVACGGESSPSPSSGEGRESLPRAGSQTQDESGGEGRSASPSADDGAPSSASGTAGTSTNGASGSGTSGSSGGPGTCVPDNACGGLTQCSDYSYGEAKCTLHCRCDSSIGRLSCTMTCS